MRRTTHIYIFLDGSGDTIVGYSPAKTSPATRCTVPQNCLICFSSVLVALMATRRQVRSSSFVEEKNASPDAAIRDLRKHITVESSVSGNHENVAQNRNLQYIRYYFCSPTMKQRARWRQKGVRARVCVPNNPMACSPCKAFHGI